MKSSMCLLTSVLSMLLGLVSSSVLGAALTRPVQQAERSALFPSKSMLELGRAVADTACATCHGMDGMQTGMGQPYLAGQRAIYLYRVLQVHQERELEDDSKQQVVHFLNDEAMLSVAAYYASLSRPGKTGLREVTVDEILTADEPFSAIREALVKCVKCHGETGNSTASGKLNLTAQDPEYFVASMNDYIDGSRKHKLMKRLAGRLDDSTIRQMGIFYAVQEPTGTRTQGEGDVEAGRLLAEKCGTCHGEDGNAEAKDTPSLAGQDARYFVKAMKAYKEGKRQHEDMIEAADGLNEADFNNLATFYANQKPVRREVRRPLKTTEWIARCERCHGINGNSIDPRFPMLAGQNRDYLKAAIQAYANKTRNSTVMHAMTEPLSAADVERIASYYAAQEPKSVIYIQLPCAETTDQ